MLSESGSLMSAVLSRERTFNPGKAVGKAKGSFFGFVHVNQEANLLLVCFLVFGCLVLDFLFVLILFFIVTQ